MELNQVTSLSLLFHLETIIAQSHAFLRNHGIMKPDGISPNNRAIFASWPPERLQKTIRIAEASLRVHLIAEAEPLFDFDDSPRLLSVALRELGLGIDPEFYSMIERSDVLEVYDTDNIQIFRSFNFFRICNYNLDDILAHEWYELYERAESVTDQIMASVKTHLLGSGTISSFNIPEHLMRERFSEAKGVFVTSPKHIASVYSGPERKPGFVCTLNAKILGSSTSELGFLASKRNAKIDKNNLTF